MTPAERARRTGGQVLRGLAMGSVELVPGVSSGTVALVLGIYERLVHAISTAASAAGSLLRGRPRETARHLAAFPWGWVLTLLVGIAVGVLVLAGPLERLLLDHPQAMAGLFFGLIVGAVVACRRMLRRPTAAVGFAAAFAAVVFFLVLGLQTAGGDVVEDVSRPLWAFFLSGAVAVCAMILPGVSGSFILVLLGMYAQMLGALNERNLPVIAVFLLGCAIGLASFAKVLDWLLAHHHDLVLGALIGLMLGSLRLLWPWPHGLDSPEIGAPSGTVAAPVLLAVAGFALVVLVDRLAHPGRTGRSENVRSRRR